MFSSTEVKGKHPDAGNFFPQYMRLLSVAGNKSLQLSKQHLLFLAQPSWSHTLVLWPGLCRPAPSDMNR